jgi:hypothetical protein
MISKGLKKMKYRRKIYLRLLWKMRTIYLYMFMHSFQSYGSILSEENIAKAYEIMLTNKDQDFSEMFDQLWERIKIYYKTEQAKFMKSILNYLAKKKRSTPEEEIIRSIEGDPETLKECLSLLLRDHYLVCQGHPKRNYEFKYDLIKKWWQYNKA